MDLRRLSLGVYSRSAHRTCGDGFDTCTCFGTVGAGPWVGDGVLDLDCLERFRLGIRRVAATGGDIIRILAWPGSIRGCMLPLTLGQLREPPASNRSWTTFRRGCCDISVARLNARTGPAAAGCVGMPCGLTWYSASASSHDLTSAESSHTSSPSMGTLRDAISLGRADVESSGRKLCLDSRTF